MDELKDRKYFAGAPAHLHDGAPACENDSAPAHLHDGAPVCENDSVPARENNSASAHVYDGVPAHASARGTGKVAIVGAGCGVGTLTLRAAELLRRADRVVYDSLIDPSILALCPPGCELLHMGKRAGSHSAEQGEIVRALLEGAARHPLTVRLHGGDPFVFGRGGEEALALSAAGIEAEYVPGVTSAAAAAGFAGIPLTHRGAARSFRVVTAHTAHLIVAMVNHDGDPVECGLTFVKLVDSCLRASDALGVYENDTVYRPEFFMMEAEGFRSREIIPVLAMIWIGMYRTSEGVSAYTVGLGSYARDEMEVLDADDESYNVMNFLYDVVYHMFLTGTVFKDGDTFGFGPEQVLTVNRSAGVSLDGYTLKLQYPGRRDTGSGSEGNDDIA